MATVSQVKAGLDEIAEHIRQARTQATTATSSLQNIVSTLDAIPAAFADVITTIDGYTPTGAFETNAKDERTKLAAEFTALKTAAQSAITALGG